MAGAPSSVHNAGIRPIAPLIPLGAPIMPMGSSNLSGPLVSGIVPPIPDTYQTSKPADMSSSKKVKTDWAIPHSEKLKYCQQFNQLDKQRNGALNGIHARNVLAQSQLPNVTLAEIWNLSDVNKDGRLSVEEFCIAMHLIDSVKVSFIFNFVRFV